MYSKLFNVNFFKHKQDYKLISKHKCKTMYDW